jgi:uncharacterized C2H2 Zn-finger protein
MEEKASQENNVNTLFRCPHCTCCFCTEADLKRHMETYGTSKGEHSAEFQRTHGRLEHSGFSGPE